MDVYDYILDVSDWAVLVTLLYIELRCCSYIFIVVLGGAAFLEVAVLRLETLSGKAFTWSLAFPPASLIASATDVTARTPAIPLTPLT